MAATNESQTQRDRNVNGTLDQRRVQRDAEHMITESASRMAEMASSGMGLMQKQLEMSSAIFHWYGDMCMTMCTSMEHAGDRVRRAV